MRSAIQVEENRNVLLRKLERLMVPFIGVPKTIAQGMSAYRAVFCRDEGFEHVSRYISGLLLSKNKTLQGIHAQQVYLERKANWRDQTRIARALSEAQLPYGKSWSNFEFSHVLSLNPAVVMQFAESTS